MCCCVTQFGKGVGGAGGEGLGVWGPREKSTQCAGSLSGLDCSDALATLVLDSGQCLMGSQEG